MLPTGRKTDKNSVYHVVIVSANLSHKPELPKKEYDDFLIIINQSSMSYNVNNKKNEFEIKISNPYLSKDELTIISRELVPENSEKKYHVF